MDLEEESLSLEQVPSGSFATVEDKPYAFNSSK